MKLLLNNQFLSLKTWCFQEGSPDRGPSGEVVTPRPEGPRIPEGRYFNPELLGPDGREIQDLTGELAERMGEIRVPNAFERLLQGEGGRLGANGENMTDLVGRLGLEGNEAGLDGLIAGMENFLGGVDMETATPRDFLQAIFSALDEAGVDTGDARNNSGVRNSVTGLGASTGAYDIEGGGARLR